MNPTTQRTRSGLRSWLAQVPLVIGLITMLAPKAQATTCAGATAISIATPISNQTVVCGAANDISAANVTNICSGASTSYLGGNEAVYTFTAPSSSPYAFSLNSTQTWTGIWLFNGCPTSGGTCVSYIQSSASGLKTINATLVSGQTYYLLFETWPAPASACPGTFSVDPIVAPSCGATYTPVDLATNVNTSSALSWSGFTGSPAPVYDVYLSTNSALVNSLDASVRVATGISASTFSPSLLPSTTYYWRVVAINGGGSATCPVLSFSTAAPALFTATSSGGLWSSPASWAGGVVPGPGNDVTIPAGSTITVDQALILRDLTINGTLNWAATSFALTCQGNLVVGSTGTFFPISSGGTGQTLNLLGNFTNNGYANLIISGLVFSGTNHTFDGTGTFAGNGTRGIIQAISMQGTGTLTINTSANLAIRGTINALQGTINGNGKLIADNTVAHAGTVYNQQLANAVVTNMGAGVFSAPPVTGTWTGGVTGLFVASGGANAGDRIVEGSNVYLVTTTGILDVVAPTHTSGLAFSGTAELLWIGNTGTIGNGFNTTVVAGTQYWYGGNLYTCTVGGATSATAPPVHTSGAAASGAATFVYVGAPAVVSPNYDATTQTVRSLTIVNPGSGLHASPGVTFVGTFTTAPTAVTQVLTGVAGATNLAMNKQATATVTGGIGMGSSQGVGSISPNVNSFGYYATAPVVALSGPTGINLLSAPVSGVTGAGVTATFTDGTLRSGAGTLAVVVGGGKVLSVVLTGTGTYNPPPTQITLNGGGLTSVIVPIPAGCWATATANLNAAGQLTSYTITNPGFGYVNTTTAPTVFLSTPVAGLEVAAGAPIARCNIYNLTAANFTGITVPSITTPVFTNAPHTEANLGDFMPANRRINALTMGAGNLGLSLTGNLTMYQLTTPITFTSGELNMGGNNLTYESPTFLGQSSGASSWVTNGSITLNGKSTATLTRTFPFRASGVTGAVQLNVGSGSNNTGSDISQIRVTQMAAPTGSTVTPATNMAGTRSYMVEILSGTVHGTNPTALVGFDASDALVSDNQSLFLCQSTTGISGPWDVRSTAAAAGPLAIPGTRTTATAAPGPIVFASTYYLGLSISTSFVIPPPLSYNVTRTTGNAYQSIAPVLVGGDGTGTLSTASGDEGTQAVAIPGWGFQYQGSTCTGFTVHTNGYVMLTNGLVATANTGSSWDNTLGITSIGGTPNVNKRNVLAPFYDDLNKASPVIYYKVSGTAPNQVVTVEWFNTTFFGLSGPQMYYQVVMDGTTGTIRFNYGDMQLFNGTQNIRYSYTTGLSGAFIQAPAQPGQIFQQQYENTSLFSHENSNIANWGANGLAIAPEPRSSILFTPGAYTPPAPPVAAAPVNDDPAGAITRPALITFPNNIAWDNGSNTTNIYTTRYATATPSPAPCSPNTGAAAKDVWFKFTATQPAVTVRIYGSGGFIPRVEVYDNTLTTPLACNVSTGITGNTTGQGLRVDAVATGLTVGNLYYARVYHDRVGTTALATATVGGGAVNGFTVTTPGTNYSQPQQAFGYNGSNQGPIVRFNGGGGNGAVGALTNPTSPSQVLASITTSNFGFNGGFGYSSAPTVTIDSPDWGITGEFGIVIYAPAPNDDCAGAITLTPGTTCVPGVNQVTDNTTSTTPSAQTAVCGTPDDDMWYKFTATSTATNVEATGTGTFDVAVQVFDGGVAPGSCGSMTSVACQNSTFGGQTEILSLTTVVGNTYFVRVYHAGTGSVPGETFTLCVGNLVPNCVANPTAPLNNAYVCSTSAVTLSWPAATYATGYTVILDGNPVSTNQPGTTYAAGVLAAGAHTWQVIPQNTNGSATGCSTWNFTVNSLGCYCSSIPSNTADEEIYSVTFNGVTSGSAADCNIVAPGPGSILNRYSNYWTLGSLFTFIQGAPSTFSITQDECDGATYFSNGIAIWIDLNQDGSFDDNTEKMFVENTTAAGPRVVNGGFVIPPTALTGTTALRVICAEGFSGTGLTSCLSYGYGETEDYLVTINPPPPCVDPPTPGTASISAANVCVGSSVTLSVTGQSFGAGLVLQWESSPDQLGWNPIGGANGITASVSPTVLTYYRLSLTCSGGSPVYTNTVSVNINPFTDCYCASGATFATDEEIYAVTLNGVTNGSTIAGGSNPGCTNPAPGPGSILGRYSNFKPIGPTWSLTQGLPVNFTVQEDECDGATYYSFGTAIWIDLNQDGVFDNITEKVFVENATAQGPRNVTGTFSIPFTATPGVTGMRVTIAENISGAGLTSCLSYGYGETEDYLVNIVAGNNNYTCATAAPLSCFDIQQAYLTGTSTLPPTACA
ncbi:MAG: hypothetical protein JNL05_05825, partial [Flavobacteriales bacterium]|nr:hypothetical protein [Flavobacteriales bacterium]